MCKLATKNYMPCKSVVLEIFATIDPLQLSIMESPLSDFEIAREPSVWLYKWALPCYYSYLHSWIGRPSD